MSDHARTAEMMNQTVHAGLRRDIRRYQASFAEPSPPTRERREALADHVVWVADFLRKHHTGEDTAIWPRVRDKCPELGPFLDIMESEHHAMAEALNALEASAVAWRTNGSEVARSTVSNNLDAFAVVCVAHLDHEEKDGIPQIAQVLDDDDWTAISKVMRGRSSMSEMGYTLLWMLDDLDQPHTQVMEEQIPTPVMWFLRRRFGSRYAKNRAQLWGPTPAA